MNLLSKDALEERIRHFENIGWRAKLKENSEEVDFEITKNGEDFSPFLRTKLGIIGDKIDRLYETDREAIAYAKLIYSDYKKHPNKYTNSD